MNVMTNRKGEYIPWPGATGGNDTVTGGVNHSGQPVADSELIELAKMEAAERAYRPMGHGKVYVSGYLADRNGGQGVRAFRGNAIQSLRGVGQPTIDGFINNQQRNAALASFIRALTGGNQR